MDLLSAIMHELGHLLGIDIADDGLTEDALDADVRRVPSSDATATLDLDLPATLKRRVRDALFSHQSGVDELVLSRRGR